MDQLDDAVDTVVAWLQAGERVYLHCRAGWQRSASVAAGAVAIIDGIEIEAALAQIQRRKPTADPLPHQRQDLARWWARRTAAGSVTPPREGGEP
jgi:protein-tyrosine phosphatase